MQALIKTLFFSIIVWGADLNHNVLASDELNPDENKLPPTRKGQAPQILMPKDENPKFHQQLTNLNQALQDELSKVTNKNAEESLFVILKIDTFEVCGIVRDRHTGSIVNFSIPNNTL